LAREKAPLAVLQSHGRSDPILPFAGAVLLRDALVEAGLALEFVEFQGGHAIPNGVLDALSRFVEDRFGAAP
jgi:phospholipase/carboxylesterase